FRAWVRSGTSRTWSSPLRARWSGISCLKSILSMSRSDVDDDGEGAIVDERHLHIGTELARGHGDAAIAELLSNSSHERFGLLPACRCGPGGAPSLARV